MLFLRLHQYSGISASAFAAQWSGISSTCIFRTACRNGPARSSQTHHPTRSRHHRPLASGIGTIASISEWHQVWQNASPWRLLLVVLILLRARRRRGLGRTSLSEEDVSCSGRRSTDGSPRFWREVRIWSVPNRRVDASSRSDSGILQYPSMLIPHSLSPSFLQYVDRYFQTVRMQRLTSSSYPRLYVEVDPCSFLIGTRLRILHLTRLKILCRSCRPCFHFGLPIQVSP